MIKLTDNKWKDIIIDTNEYNLYCQGNMQLSEDYLRWTYKPLRNILNSDGTIGDFIDINKITYGFTSQVQMEVQKTYDNSVNLIITDNNSVPKLINTGFQVKDNNKYSYVSRENLGNFYSKENINDSTNLQLIYNNIPKIDYEGFIDSGTLKCGNYYFYFKYADWDGNTTDIVAQSNLIPVFIGKDGDPFSIKGGVRNEDSNKSIKFKLTNLDSNYNRLQILYQRSTSDPNQNSVTEYKLLNDFIQYSGQTLDLNITGFEETTDISREDINQQYTIFKSAKTIAQHNNRLFVGNVQLNSNYDSELKSLSLQFLPYIDIQDTKDVIGHIDADYNKTNCPNAKFNGEYYDSRNVYYYLGYMPGEFYRLGVVYVYKDGNISSVYNIRGGVLAGSEWYTDIQWFEHKEGSSELPENPIFKNYEFDESGFIDESTKENTRGVIYIDQHIGNGIDSLFGIKIKTDKNVLKYLHDKEIIGYYFVRQKRLPLKVTQMFTIPMNDGSDLPVTDGSCIEGLLPTTLNINLQNLLRDWSGYGGLIQGENDNLNDLYKWLNLPKVNRFNYTDNFDKNQKVLKQVNRSMEDAKLVQEYARRLIPARYAYEKAAGICPDYIVKSPYLNQLFCNSKFVLQKESVIALETFAYDDDKRIFKYATHYHTNAIDENKNDLYNTVYLIAVPEGVDGVTADNKTFRSKSCNSTEAIGGRVINTPYYGGVVQELYLTSCALTQLSYDYGEYGKDTFYIARFFNISRGIFGPYIGIGFNNVKPLNYSTLITNTNETLLGKYPFYLKNGGSGGNHGEDDYAKQISRYKQWLYNGNIVPEYTDKEGNTIQNSIAEKDRVDLFCYYNVYIPGYSQKNFDEYWKIRMTDNSGYYQIGQRVQIDDSNNYEDIFYSGDRFICQVTQRMKRNFQSEGAPTNDLIVDPYTYLKGLKESDGNDTSKIKDINVGDLNAIKLGNWITVKVESNYNLILRSIDSSNVNETQIFGHGRGFYPAMATSAEGSNKIPDSSVLNDGYNIVLSDKVYARLPDTPYRNNYFKNRIYYSELSREDSITNGYRTFKANNFVDYNQEFGSITKILDFYNGLFVVLEHGIIYIEIQEKSVASDGSDIYINYNKILPERATRIISSDYGSKWIDSVINTPVGVYGIDTVSKKIWGYTGSSQLQLVHEYAIEKFLNNNMDVNYNDNSYSIGVRDIKTYWNSYKKELMFTYYNFETLYNKLQVNDNISNIKQLVKDTNNITQWNIGFSYINNTPMFTTFYSWMPLLVANIDNSMYTINSDLGKGIRFKDLFRYLNPNYNDELITKLPYIWKHGETNIRMINEKFCDQPKPTNWYGIQYPFEFEFVVKNRLADNLLYQNLFIISNNAEPESFSFTVTGDSYEFKRDLPNIYYRQEATKKLWHNLGSLISYDKDYTDIIPNYYATITDRYTNDPYAINKQGVSKSTFFPAYYKRYKLMDDQHHTELSANVLLDSKHDKIWDWSYLSGSYVTQNDRTKQFNITTNIKCNTREKYGILKSNSQYTEGVWKVQIPQINLVQKNEEPWYNGLPPIIIDYLPNDITNPNITKDSLPDQYKDQEVQIPNSNNSYWPKYLSLQKWTTTKQMPIKDKFIKIRVRYNGKSLALINGIITSFVQSNG